jgi:hypothetical protein
MELPPRLVSPMQCLHHPRSRSPNHLEGTFRVLVQSATRPGLRTRRPTVLESLERRCLLAATAAPATPVHLDTNQPAGQVTLHLESGAETTPFVLPGGALPGNPQGSKSQHDSDSGYEKSNGVLSRSVPNTFARDSNVEDGPDPPATLDFDDPLALDARLQATAIQLTGTMLRAADDANAQSTSEGTVFATSNIELAPTLKASMKVGAAGDSSQAKPTGAAADAWDSFETWHDTTLDALALAAATHRLLRHIGATPNSEPFAATPPETEWAWEWTLALPLAPRLSIDVERLGEALDAVLADIEELGGQFAGSLIDGDRIFWALVVSGMACYVAGARSQVDTAAVSPTPRNERVPPRRLHRDGSTRYLVAR